MKKLFRFHPFRISSRRAAFAASVWSFKNNVSYTNRWTHPLKVIVFVAVSIAVMNSPSEAANPVLKSVGWALSCDSLTCTVDSTTASVYGKSLFLYWSTVSATGPWQTNGIPCTKAGTNMGFSLFGLGVPTNSPPLWFILGTQSTSTNGIGDSSATNEEVTSCENGTSQDPCYVTSIRINSGYNPWTGHLTAQGSQDNYWSLIEDASKTGSVPRPATVVVGPTNVWGTTFPTISNCEWIGAYSNYTNDSNGYYIYQRTFCLDSAVDVDLNFQYVADDEAQVFFNPTGTPPTYSSGLVAGSTTPMVGFINPTVVNATVHGIKAKNVIDIVVDNTSSVATGMALSGTISITNPNEYFALSDTCCTAVGFIDGRKWLDINCDGKIDTNGTAADSALSGWKINISPDPNGVSPLTTDGQGWFYFNNLPGGTYTITEVPQSGYHGSPNNSGPYTIILKAGEIVDTNFLNCPGFSQTGMCPCDSASFTPYPGIDDNSSGKTITIYNVKKIHINHVELQYYDCSGKNETQITNPTTLDFLRGGQPQQLPSPGFLLPSYDWFNTPYARLPLLPTNSSNATGAFSAPIQTQIIFNLTLPIAAAQPAEPTQWCIKLLIIHDDGDTCIVDLPSWDLTASNSTNGSNTGYPSGHTYGLSVNPRADSNSGPHLRIPLGYVSISTTNSGDTIIGGTGGAWYGELDSIANPTVTTMVQSNSSILFTLRGDTANISPINVFISTGNDSVRKPQVVVRLYDVNSKLLTSDTVTASKTLSIVNPPSAAPPANDVEINSVIPNPATSSVAITYTLGTNGPAHLELFNTLGQSVGVLADGFQTQGEHQINYNVLALPGGTYYLRLSAGSEKTSAIVTVIH